MKTLKEQFLLIDTVELEEQDRTAVKFILLQQEIDTLPSRHEFELLHKDFELLRKDVDKSEHKILLRCGGMIAVAAGVVVGLLKLL